LEGRYNCPLGVPPGCGYCSVPSSYGPPKSRSVTKIIEEVRRLLSMGVRRIVLSAPGFLDYGRDISVEPQPLTDPRHPKPNHQALEELLSQLTRLDRVAEGEASVMIENIKGCLVTRKAAEILGRYLAGTPVNIGFETGSREHSIQLGRPSTPDENLRALKRLKKAGLKPYVYFIHGLPGQTCTTVDETVRIIGRSAKAGASRIIMYRFRPLPMSAFHDQPMAPPAVKDVLGKRLHDAAREANMMMKENLVGKRFRVVIAEPYKRDLRYHVAYPLLHGPVVIVDGAEGLVGEVVEVEVIGVVSERMVLCRLLDGMF
jgi:tRNA-2-methylthio-N6-dimethylallyladenosine synthase